MEKVADLTINMAVTSNVERVIYRHRQQWLIRVNSCEPQLARSVACVDRASGDAIDEGPQSGAGANGRRS